mgnify:CR=1 FL=1
MSETRRKAGGESLPPDRKNEYSREELLQCARGELFDPARLTTRVTRRVLFAGDLVFNGGHPNNVGGSIAGTVDIVTPRTFAQRGGRTVA